VKNKRPPVSTVFLEDNCLIKTYLNSGYPYKKVFEINFGGNPRASEAAVAVKNSVTNGNGIENP
jgi:hypothetical protein